MAHRRAGKTVACVMDLVRAAIQHKAREPRFAYVAPTYSQAKDVAWSYLKEYTAAIPGIKFSESELSVTFPHNEARIRLYGAENYDRIRGLYLDGVVIDEYGDIDPRVWPEVIRPALSDRQGWATFIGTPKGRNQFYKLNEAAKSNADWFHEMLYASRTGLLDAKELADAQSQMTPEQYAQEYECSFDAAIVGAYYGKEISQAEKANRITRVPYDTHADVYASWDLGHADATAIWFFQIIRQEWHWIWYYENSGKGPDHYVDVVKELPFKVYEHILPHDGGAIEKISEKSYVQFLRERKFNCRDPLPPMSPHDRISAARVRFNRFWFDAEHCARGIDCLRMYHAEYNEKLETLRDIPVHNWASHGADAFGYGVIGGEEDFGPKVLPQIGNAFQASA